MHLGHEVSLFCGVYFHLADVQNPPRPHLDTFVEKNVFFGTIMCLNVRSQREEKQIGAYIFPPLQIISRFDFFYIHFAMHLIPIRFAEIWLMLICCERKTLFVR